MTLDIFTDGTFGGPVKCLFYGTPGFGKSTIASKFPDPVFLDIEGGLKFIKAKRSPKITSLEQLLKIVKELIDKPHDAKALVVDTIDWVQNLIFEHVAAAHNKDYVSEIGFNKGIDQSVDIMSKLLKSLETLQVKRNMHIILTGHSKVKAYNSPTLESYDRHILAMNEKVAEPVIQWCDGVIFCDYKVNVTEKEDGRMKGVGTGERTLFCQERPAYRAKNRFGLPEKIENVTLANMQSIVDKIVANASKCID